MEIMQRSILTLALSLVFYLGIGVVWGAEVALPEGPGLSAHYVGDAGLARDPAVIFVDNFEADDITWDGDTKHPTTTNIPAYVHTGARSFEVVASPTGNGGGLVKWFDPGYDRVFARWYVMFEEGFDQNRASHLGGSLNGYRDHSMLGASGKKPAGDDFFITTLDCWDWRDIPPPGELVMYTYHMDLLPDTPAGDTWGRAYLPEKSFRPDKGRWYCFEIMVQTNTPGQADGEQAFWVDGKLLGHFKGLRWRGTENLKINGFWLYVFIRNSLRENHLWYDDVVVARSYIGPMIAGPEVILQPCEQD